MMKHPLIWVKRADSPLMEDEALRERAKIEDSSVDVHVESLVRFGVAIIPAGYRDEWGGPLPGIMNIGHGELPPDGLLFLANEVP